LRIGFTGAQGTGKTTAAKAAWSIFPRRTDEHWTIVPSTARACLDAGYSINRDADPLSQLITLIARMNEENNLAERYSVISDRTPIDSLAYTAFQFNEVWKDPNAFYWTQCSDLVKHHMPKYDAVILFPPYWAPEGDGIRDPDIEWQHKIHQMIVDLLETMEVKHLVMPNVSVEERAKWLFNVYKSFDLTPKSTV